MATIKKNQPNKKKTKKKAIQRKAPQKTTKKKAKKKETKKTSPKSAKKTTKKTTKKYTKKKTTKKVAKKQTTVKKAKGSTRHKKSTAKKSSTRTRKRVNRVRNNSRTPHTFVHKNSKTFDSQNYLNRDLSWLDFNARVLHEALDERTPLLERLRFMNIWRSNNDEFFMKRVGALFNKRERGNLTTFLSGHTAKELFKEIHRKTQYQQTILTRSFQQDLIPALQKEGIRLLKWHELTKNDKMDMLKYFEHNIFPILTPLAVDSGHPFPFISNLSKSIGVCIRRPKSRSKQFARVKVPTGVPHWIRLEKNRQFEYRFINIEEIIMAHLHLLFKGMIIDSACLFRVTRNAAISEEGDDAEDKMEWVEEGLRERKFAPVVRLETLPDADPWIIEFLEEELMLTPDNLFVMEDLPSYTNFSEVIDIKRKDLKYNIFTSKTPQLFNPKGEGDLSLFAMIRQKDTLVHFPYESFSNSVEAFVNNAANDKKVLAIKIILYRTDSDGRLIDALIQAAENKIQVAVIIELKARFDEERNIKWAQKLEEAGIHVSYGLMDLKTHAKMLMVVRKDSDGVRTYVNIGTGNYNSQTSRLYTDYGLFTCDPKICQEVMEVFNYLTGRSIKKDYKNLLVAPFTMHETFVKHIRKEKENALAGKPAKIIAKMNQLEEPLIIDELYQASLAGVEIHLFVRGFCCLRPGVTGMSENIHIYSIVGRLLEHSRIFYFQNGADQPQEGSFYIGSADWMSRNLFDRVEVITPIFQKNLKRELWDYLNLCLKDNRHLWELKSDGTYVQRKPLDKKTEINSQKELIKS
jgi:polyphosphate kinase